jgi:hypothetical protein
VLFGVYRHFAFHRRENAGFAGGRIEVGTRYKVKDCTFGIPVRDGPHECFRKQAQHCFCLLIIVLIVVPLFRLCRRVANEPFNHLALFSGRQRTAISF